MPTKTFIYNRPFTLENGFTLPVHQLAYTTYGKLNEAKDNVVWIFHALTANSDPAEWWQGLVGSGKLFNPENHFIICVNMPGSCYGSTGPLDIDIEKSEPYFHDFPYFTTRDMIRSYQLLKDQLGITSIFIGIGGSMGGQQLLEWAIDEPNLFRHIIPIATNAFHSPWGIAFNASQRMAIEADSTWQKRSDKAGMEGMKVARSMALLSYRHYDTYGSTQAETNAKKIENFKAESYQRYQGQKLARRFNAFSYFFLSKAMDSHNVGRDRNSAAEALQKIKAKTLVIGIDTDILFPVTEQVFIAKHISGAIFKSIHSNYGHDGFLVENWLIENLIIEFLLHQPTVDANSTVKIRN